MKKYNYMDTIPTAKKYIRIGAIIYVFLIILFTIVFRRMNGFNDLSSFAKMMYISVPIILIIIVILLYIKEITGAILSIVFIAIYNFSSLFFQTVRDLEIQINLFFVFGALFLFLYFFEKAIKSEQVDYQILVNRYEQLKFNAEITKAMAEITPRMLMNDDLDELLQNILEKAIKLIPKAQSGSILIKNRSRMEFRAALGYDLDALRKIDLYFEDMYQYKLGALDEPAVIRDMKTFNEFNLNAKTAKDMNEHDFLVAKSVLTCSIILNDTIYGFINLDNLDDFDAFTEQDKTYIKHLASQIEIALNNHLLVEQIYNLSRYDSLTGINSRKYHEKLINALIEESKDENKEFSIIVIDVNNLKQINDSYGHTVGDQYLVHFVDIIQKNTNNCDIFSRTGGDEFVLAIPDATHEQATIRVDEIRETAKNNPYIHNSVEHIIEFGCGVACYPKDGLELTELTKIADQRMYDDKKISKKSKYTTLDNY